MLAVALAQPMLYGTDGSTFGPSNLYTIDTTTGVATFVAQINDGTTQTNGVTAIAFDPTNNGVLYGVKNSVDANPLLVTIDRFTGTWTLVGAMSAVYGQTFYRVPDLAFNEQGQLYGWTGPGNTAGDLIIINKNNGNAVLAGTYTGGDTVSPGLTFVGPSMTDSWLKTGTDLCQINSSTGQNTATGCLGINTNFDPYANALAFDMLSARIYTICEDRAFLCYMDLSTVGVVSPIPVSRLPNGLNTGTDPNDGMAGLAIWYAPIVE